MRTCLQCTKKSLIIPNFLISCFSTLYDYGEKDFNEFILKLGKGVMCYKYIDLWNRFNKKPLPSNEIF